jgi:hypothetical protein
MDMDTDKIDDMILALLWLGAHGDGMATRAWKSFALFVNRIDGHPPMAAPRQ